MNAFAQLILLLWLPLGLLAASTLGRQKAFCLIFFGGFMFLPERVRFDFPLLPPLDKNSVSALTGWLACLLFASEPEDRLHKSSSVQAIAFASIFGAIVTALTNLDPIDYGVRKITGMNPTDAIGFSIRALISQTLPFLLGWKLFRTPDALRMLLKALVIATLIYVPLVLFEARMSPTLHIKLYGFFQHSWAQMKRDGGFRAIVFMSHGLEVAFLMSQGVIASAGAWRAKLRLPFSVPHWLAFLLLVGALLSCKSAAAIAYAVIGVPLIFLTAPGFQLTAARALSGFIIVYPIVRLNDWLDTDWVLDMLTQVFERKRIDSLAFRFDMEQVLLAHARDRLLFGWGGYGRSEVFSEETGRDMTVVDGEWISRLGQGGLFLYLLSYLSLLGPCFYATKTARFIRERADLYTLSTFALLLAFTGLNTLPNARSHELSLVLAGALTGTCSTMMARARAASRQVYLSQQPSAPVPTH